MLWPVASFTWVSDPGGSLLPYGKMYVYNGLEVLHWPFSYRLCKLSACNVSLWCITGFFYLHTVTTSGWTVETTSVTGHRPRTRIAHSPCLRSELSQQMSPSGPNPSKLVPLSFSAVRRSTVSTHTQNKFDPIMGHTSEGSKLVRSLRFAFLATGSILTEGVNWRIQALLDAKVESRHRTSRVVARSPRNFGEKLSITFIIVEVAFETRIARSPCNILPLFAFGCT